MFLLPIRIYLVAGVILMVTLVGIGIYSKGRSDSKATIQTQAYKEERRVIQTATTARRIADVHNSVGDGLRANDGFRRD
jgi:hypothetical protein